MNEFEQESKLSLLDLSDSDWGRFLIEMAAIWADKTVLFKYPSSESNSGVNLVHIKDNPAVFSYLLVSEDKGDAEVFNITVSFIEAKGSLQVLRIPEQDVDLDSAGLFMQAQSDTGLANPNPEELQRFKQIVTDQRTAIRSKTIEGGPVGEDIFLPPEAENE